MWCALQMLCSEGSRCYVVMVGEDMWCGLQRLCGRGCGNYVVRVADAIWVLRILRAGSSKNKLCLREIYFLWKFQAQLRLSQAMRRLSCGVGCGIYVVWVLDAMWCGFQIYIG